MLAVGATLSLLEKLTATEVSGEPAIKADSENRTIRALVKQYQSGEESYLREHSQKLSPEEPISEWNGGFFPSDREAKEPFTVTTWNEEGTEIVSELGDAATVGEVIEAISSFRLYFYSFVHSSCSTPVLAATRCLD
ncbi:MULTISPECIES: hypothetical protein [unclassified Streptococcus]|uniref:hypothetical protein n=1 Tax=unclassified Streptococcus TaxID=2608887 RepID=UPI0010726E7D|nr:MULTISPECIES: hypothetical protein [unclassified Streptococcus]MBF0787870.1 hypothetical protein [Streptococcus sp. 19428wC2_LYSM12]MCQ9211153.1 hypothetical protein [Streptococcus sp. B01]MCQ9214428.1 hypothetical protein [Streptococcus sp. O1]TFV05120.1 hypothetical protein E4T79_08270 [Streptococcus sp. LYSM12]